MTPSCLRGGGATAFYEATENLPLLQERARWKRLETLQIYVQEVAPAEFLMRLPVHTRERIFRLSEHFHIVVHTALEFLQQGHPVSMWYDLFCKKFSNLECSISS